MTPYIITRKARFLYSGKYCKMLAYRSKDFFRNAKKENRDYANEFHAHFTTKPSFPLYTKKATPSLDGKYRPLDCLISIENISGMVLMRDPYREEINDL